MAVSNALTALAVIALAALTQSQRPPVPELFGQDDETVEDAAYGDMMNFDISMIPFGQTCSEDMPISDQMKNLDVPCLKCGCHDNHLQCLLTPGGEMCSKLERFGQMLSEGCYPGAEMEMLDDMPCGCFCNDYGQWDCWDAESEGNTHCQLIKFRAFIALTPTRVKDLSVLYPQHCLADGEHLLHGQYMVKENCEIKICVDGVLMRKQNEEWCDEDNNLIPKKVACYDRSGPVNEMGTYIQNGPRYRMCIFGWWKEAKFVAAMKKPGRCHSMNMTDMAEKPTCEGGKVHECVHDIDCEGQMKCCFKGCGGVCVMPEMKEEKEEGMLDESKGYVKQHCTMEDGEMIPSGRIFRPSECQTCVCLNGETKCYSDKKCGPPPTCTCGPPSDAYTTAYNMEFDEKINIPFGTIWPVGECTACVCLDGKWECKDKEGCGPSKQNLLYPCPPIAGQSMPVASGETSPNGCCTCVNGIWICDTPECNNSTEPFVAKECMHGNMFVRSGAYQINDCELKVCINGKTIKTDLCQPEGPPKPEDPGLCPLKEAPSRFDRNPFPWHDFETMMRMKEGMGEGDWDGMPGGPGGRSGDMMGEGGHGEMPNGPGGRSGDMMGEGGRGEMPGMGGDMGEMVDSDWRHMKNLTDGDMDIFSSWLQGNCSMDSDCNGTMKCCGNYLKNCVKPIEQPQPAQCMNSAGNMQYHGYLSTGNRNPDTNKCLTCLCFDGRWMCETFPCTAGVPSPPLSPCTDAMGEQVPTGTMGIARGCKAIACFGGYWFNQPLSACMELKKKKDGMCPRVDPRTVRCMADREPMCHADGDCGDDMKCCFNGCTLACTQPQDTHWGECPRPSFREIMMKGPCYEEDQETDMCTSDGQCGDGKKCCYNGCHKTCEESKAMPTKPICIDPNNLYTLPYRTGQIRHEGKCGICVCVESEWMCYNKTDCTDSASMLKCPTFPKEDGTMVPSGSLDIQSCIYSVCFDGIWQHKLSPKCCPMIPKPCKFNDVTIPSGTYKTGKDPCIACICLNGIMTCKEFDSDKCNGDKVKVPSCWGGYNKQQEFFTGDIMSHKGKKCLCLFGNWRCGSWIDADKQLEMKDGTCPAMFDFLQNKTKNQMPGGMGMPGMGMEKPGMESMGGGHRDMSRRPGMWDARGLPERDMEDYGDGLLDMMRDYMEPPEKHMMMWDEDQYREHTRSVVGFVQNTRFGECRMDEDCFGNQICCGGQLGGVCVRPERKLSSPKRCMWDGKYYRHGSIHKGEQDGLCKACACVHGMWECDSQECDQIKDDLKMCNVSLDMSGLQVPTGAQQFLQCELCVCLNGGWRCNNRDCMNKGFIHMRRKNMTKMGQEKFNFDISMIPFGMACSPDMSMEELMSMRGEGMDMSGDGPGMRGEGMGMPGDGMGMPGEGMGDGPGMRGEGMGMRGDGKGTADGMMGHKDVPCLRCGCAPTKDNYGGYQVRCQLTPGGEMCSMLEEKRRWLSESCDPGTYMDMREKNMPCGCNCNEEGQWECWTEEMAYQEGPNPLCMLMQHYRSIELPPTRTRDLSVLYPQQCDSPDGSLLHGQINVHGSCDVCVCVDGLVVCKQNKEFCDQGGKLIPDMVGCSDRDISFYPLGTYNQNGPRYKMCVFGKWKEAVFTAALKKPGTCPKKSWSDKMNTPVCEDYEDGKKHDCVHDIDCEGKMKCCFQGCGGVCVMPDLSRMREFMESNKSRQMGRPDGRPDGMDRDGPDGMMDWDMPSYETDRYMSDGRDGRDGRDGPERMDEMKQKMEDFMKMMPKPCERDDGEMVPSGRIYQPSVCETCVCFTGEEICYSDNRCAAPPTCSCGLRGTEMVKNEIPFGTIWPSGDCSACVCNNGIWDCKKIDKCKSMTPMPKPCTVSAVHNMSLPTGATTPNGCCVCINGIWTCDSPDCNNDEQFVPQSCTKGGMIVRNGAYHVKDCKLCACVNGQEACDMICLPDSAKDKMKGDMSMMDGDRMDMMGDDMDRMDMMGGGMPDGKMVSRQDLHMIRLKNMCPNMTFHCEAAETRQNMCETDDDCDVPGSKCCSNDCLKFCMKPKGHDMVAECPAVTRCAAPEHDQCFDDSDCYMEGAICCRAWQGCYGKCIVPQQEMKEGLCPMQFAPPRFDRIPFPWDDYRKMMGMEGPEEWDTDGRPMGPPGSGGMPGGDWGDRPMPGGDGDGRPMPGGDWGDGPMPGAEPMPGGGHGDRPMPGGASEWGDMSDQWSDMEDEWDSGMSYEFGDMDDEWDGMTDDMNRDVFNRWMHGNCSMDSDCDGKMKCCGTYFKNCTKPREQPAAKQCIDTLGARRDHGFVQIGDRNAELDYCMTCICFDGRWLCQKLTCTADQPRPMLKECINYKMGEIVPTGTGMVKQCHAIACVNGHWLKRPLAACIEAKKGKEGMCPRIDANRRECNERMLKPTCTIDHDCDGNMKCCFDGCTLSCASPNEVHPGTCPRPSLEDIMTMRKPCDEDDEVDMCLSDEECGDEEKCCYNGCHRTCKEKGEKPMKPVCIDLNDPNGTPYMTGQIMKMGECDMCVCVETEWFCSKHTTCAETYLPKPCSVGDNKMMPSGTLHVDGCMNIFCVDGVLHKKLSQMCCPMVPKPCMHMNGNMVPSGFYFTDLDSCAACICMNGLFTCKQFEEEVCSDGKVNVPSCWAGEKGRKEFHTGDIIPMKNKKCACFFGQWRCGSFTKMEEAMDLKEGTCPAVFDVLEKGKRHSSMSMGMVMMGMGDEDMRGGKRQGMWDQRGAPERPMEEFDEGGLMETLRDWLEPPEMRRPDGMGMRNDEFPQSGMIDWNEKPQPGSEGRPGDGGYGRPVTGGEGGSMPGDGEGRRPGGGEGPIPGGRPIPGGDRPKPGGGHQPGGGDRPLPDGDRPQPGGFERPVSGGEGGSMPGEGHRPGGGERPIPDGGNEWPMQKQPGEKRPMPDSGSSERRKDDYMSHTRMMVDYIQDTKFDGCRVDDDCNGRKICCGSQLGGACVRPEPKEALPVPCEYEGVFYAHGTVNKGEKDGNCHACACVHGMWQCDYLDCNNVNDDLEMCNVGPDAVNLQVPTGTQQFLQCEMCVCMNGKWKCSERTCGDKESDAFCPAQLPPNIYLAKERCRNSMECGDGKQCCEFEDYGKVCVPKELPNKKRGECPATVNKQCDELKECLTDSHCPGLMKCCKNSGVQERCELGRGRGVCVRPSGDHCPGGVHSYTPCGADVNPCDHVGACESNPSLTCQMLECGSCMAMFVDENWMPARCEALEQRRCELPQFDISIPIGTTFDDPRDPCQLCFCKGNGDIECTEDRRCGFKQKSIRMKFESEDCSALEDPIATTMLIREIRSQLAAFVKIKPQHFKDIQVECGSYLVKTTVVENPTGNEEGMEENTIDVDAVVDALKEAFENETVVLIIQGKEHHSVPDSFKQGKGKGGIYDILFNPIFIGIMVPLQCIMFGACLGMKIRRARRCRDKVKGIKEKKEQRDQEKAELEEKSNISI